MNKVIKSKRENHAQTKRPRNNKSVSDLSCVDKDSPAMGVLLPLSNAPDVFAIIDFEDASGCLQKTWSLHRGYVKAASRGRRFGLHTFVLGKPEAGKVIDHINGNPLDNRKLNLRFCTLAENNRNSRKTKNPTSSQFKGVYLAESNVWRAVIKFEGKTCSLGSFSNEIDAARTYDWAAIKIFGEFAGLNFPNQREENSRFHNCSYRCRIKICRAPDKKNQTKRLLTKPEREIIAEYLLCHPLAKKKAKAA